MRPCLVRTLGYSSACSLLLFATLASAQTAGGTTGTTPPLPNGVPTTGLVPGSSPFQNNFTPQQLQQLMMLRGLQARGSHGVRTGVPNPIINGGYGGADMGSPMMGNAPPQATGKGQRKTSAEKRAEARAQKEERKRMAKVGGADKPKGTKGKAKPKVERASKKTSRKAAA